MTIRFLHDHDLEAGRSDHPYAGDGGTGKAYTAMPYRLSRPGGERSLRQAKRLHRRPPLLRGQAMLLSRRNAAAADYGSGAGAAAATD